MATYTDKQLEQATQIAYADLGDAYNELVQITGRTSFTLEELKEVALDLKDDAYVAPLDNLTEEQLKTWSISGAMDNKSEGQSGFYGCIIETGDGNAILAYRGSEDMSDTRNLEQDWLYADLGLLNGTCTSQQRDAELFLEKYKDQINSYDSVSVTGHSLGGNLAEHTTIIADNYGCGENFERCVSYDGPGYSTEYIEANKDLIAKNAGKVTHYKYSVVGSLLYPLPGENGKFAKVRDGCQWDIGGRHSTSSIEFDENGNVVEGRQDFLAAFGSMLSKSIDSLPKPIGDELRDFLTREILYGVNNPEEFLNDLISFALKHPGETIFITAEVLVIGIVVVGGYYVTEGLSWVIDKVTDFVIDVASKTWDWTKEKFQEFCGFVQEKIDQFKEWCKNTFDKNYKAAKQYLNNEYTLNFDTGALFALAERLWAVNGRLESLDHRLDNLYRSAKWTDLGKIVKVASADLKIGWSNRINNCADCLRDTAGRFERVEQDIINML